MKYLFLSISLLLLSCENSNYYYCNSIVHINNKQAKYNFCAVTKGCGNMNYIDTIGAYKLYDTLQIKPIK